MSESIKSKTTYSMRELQQMLCIGSVAAYRLVRQNHFKSIKSGRSIRIVKTSFDTWLDGVSIEPAIGSLVLQNLNATRQKQINWRYPMFESEVNSVNERLSSLPSSFEKRVYTVEEIQDILSIGKNAAYDLVKTGQFHIVRIGGSIRVSKRSFDAWLDQQNS